MREYDKMIRGELYNPAEEELTAMRKHARRLEGGGVCGGRRQKRQILLAKRPEI